MTDEGDSTLHAWVAQIKAMAAEPDVAPDGLPAAVEIGHLTPGNVREPEGIVRARANRLVFERVAGDADGARLVTVQRLVRGVVGDVSPARWRGGSRGVLRELLRTCNNGYVYCRPIAEE